MKSIKRRLLPMADDPLDDVAQEKVGYPVKTVRIVAGMPDEDQIFDDIEENEFLTPPIDPHYRNDLE
jgi:hypothetical protein